MPDWSLIIPGRNNQAATAAVSHYSFAWRLSGDKAVAPLQVFDNGRRTWLQFAPQQPWPAVFEHTAMGDRPLGYTREGPYMVLSGVWPKLLLRGGHLKSLVERLDQPAPQPSAASLPEGETILKASAPVVADPATGVKSSMAAPTVAHVPGVTEVMVTPAPEQRDGPVRVPGAAPQTPASIDPISQAGAQAEPPQRYTVSPQDLNLRSALARWAREAGWTFEPEHWAVDADIPIVGSATFEPGFKFAVQDLVASTELADRPLQPCFYSNRVLRIVPYAQQCDRRVSGARPS